MDTAHKEKLLRVQGPRSQTGCQTCKLRHIKCDEALPICARCFRSKRICNYAANKSPIVDAKFILYTIFREPDQSLKIPPQERRALWHFQHRTIEQIEGPFRSELWSTIVPRLIQNDVIVREAVLALSALHEYYLNHNSDSPCLPEHALRHYQRARKMIIELESPENFFDSILCACIIFCTCKCLGGEFEEAMQHTVAGMKMIAARRASKSQGVSMFASAEDVLSNVFLALQSQVMEANVDDFHISYPGLEDEIGDVPDHFDDVKDALPHLHILMNQVLKLYQDAELHHETHSWVPSQISPSLKPKYDTVHTKFKAWKKAISRIETLVRNGDYRQHAGHLLLKIFVSSLEIYFHVFVHGETAYDDMKETNYGILSLIEVFLRIHAGSASIKASNKNRDSVTSSSYKPLSFTSSPEVVPVLFEIATRTNDPKLHQRAIELLRFSSRREGVWDAHAAANLAQQIVQLKQKGITAANNQHVGRKFLITDILLLSEQTCMVRFGFKRVQASSFNSFWLETIRPDQGSIESRILTIA